MARRLTFLIGAHKTATTHIQRALGTASDRMEAQGLRYVGTRPVGTDIIPLLDLLPRTSLPVVQAAFETAMDLHCGGFDTVLLSNENIMGGLKPRQVMGDDGLYAPAVARVAALAKLSRGNDLRIGIALRNPATFLVSAWGETMKDGAYTPFERYMGNRDATRLTWLPLIKKMQQAAPEAHFVLWRYEDYPAIAAALFDALHPGLSDIVTVRQGKRINPGFSAKAIEALKAGGDWSREAFREMQEKFPKSEEFPAYDPWTPSLRTEITDKYATDWNALTKLENVTCLSA